jgi:hypothetical protein
MLSGSLLRASLYLKSHVHRLLQGLSCLLLNRVNRLDVYLSDKEIVGSDVEGQEISKIVLLVHCILNDFGRVPMEVVKRYSRHDSSNS